MGITNSEALDIEIEVAVNKVKQHYIGLTACNDTLHHMRNHIAKILLRKFDLVGGDIKYKVVVTKDGKIKSIEHKCIVQPLLDPLVSQIADMAKEYRTRVNIVQEDNILHYSWPGRKRGDEALTEHLVSPTSYARTLPLKWDAVVSRDHNRKQASVTKQTTTSTTLNGRLLSYKDKVLEQLDVLLVRCKLKHPPKPLTPHEMWRMQMNSTYNVQDLVALSGITPKDAEKNPKPKPWYHTFVYHK